MAEKPTPAGQNSGSRNLLYWAEIALIVAIFYLSCPASPPGVNEPHYLCRLRHAVDASYCPGDLFLESPDAHYTFVLAFAWLTKFFSFATLAWLGRVGCWIALAWAWLRLSWVVVPRPLFATLGAAIVVAGIMEGNFAGEWLVGGFEAKTVAYVFVLLGLRAWLLEKWNWTWIHLGIASAWHALVGGWSVLILLTLWVMVYRHRQSLRGMLPGLALGGFIALAGIVPALALSMKAPAEVRSEAAEIYVFERLPHHLAPLHKPASWIAERAGRHAVVATLFVVLLFARRGDLGGRWRALSETPDGRFAQYAIGAIVLAIIGGAVELALWNQPDKAAGLLRYYWFRLVDVAVPMALAMLWMSHLATLLQRQDRRAPAVLSIVLLLAGFPIGQHFSQYVRHTVADANKPRSEATDWLDVCQWVKENTPTDAMFLTQRGKASFKWYAERAEVVTYKDVPQDAEHLVEWRRRLYDVYKPNGDRSLPWISGYGELGNERVAELADEYEADYIVTRPFPPLEYPILHMNDTYVVYRIPTESP